MINKGISKWNITLCRFREGHLPKASTESTSLPRKENSQSQQQTDPEYTPRYWVFPHCFSKNYHLAVLARKKIYSHKKQASYPCVRSVLWGTRSSSTTLACQKILQSFSWSRLCFNSALHSLITEGDLQSLFNSLSLSVCELNNGKSGWHCSACWRLVPKPLYRTIMTTPPH